MRVFLNIIIKVLGMLVLLAAAISFFGYHMLFDREMKYYPPESPKVQAKLSEWRDRKFGLFMHWGPYSQWGVVESWSICAEDEPWCRRTNPDYEIYKRDYENLMKTFNPVHFDPGKWASAAKGAGMQYVVFTTKHHDGFCMFDTETTQYKITGDSCAFMDNPKANVSLEIFETFRKEDFMIGAYFSKADWNTEYFWWSNFATPDRNVNYSIEKYPERWEDFIRFTHDQVMELATKYGEIDILWFDGGWVRPLNQVEHTVSDFISSLYLKAGYTQFRPPQNQNLRMSELAQKVRAQQPGIILVDRHVEGKEQDYMTPEQYVPDTYLPYPWESCITMGNSWSFSFNENYKPARQILHLLVDVVSKGGNLLLNIGPGPGGDWHDEAYKRLEEIGEWMRINQSAIYNTKGQEYFGHDQFRFTYQEDGSVNAIYLADETEMEMPDYFTIKNPAFKRIQKIELLGSNQQFTWEVNGSRVRISVPDAVRSAPPCDYAWVFRIYN